MEHDGTDMLAADSPDDETTGWLRNAAIGGLVQPGRLPDGRPCLTIGDVRGYATFNHLQGDNPEHDCGDCGVVSCADVLNQFGVRLTEADAFRHAMRRHELHVVPGRPDQSGSTLPAEQAAILTYYGVPAHAEEAQPVERLALAVQLGHGVIAMVNAGACGATRAGSVTVRPTMPSPLPASPATVTTAHCWASTSTTVAPPSPVSMSAARLMTTAFEHEGGFCVVTDWAHAPGTARST